MRSISARTIAPAKNKFKRASRGTKSEGGRGTEAERKKKRESERGDGAGRREREDGVVGRSEKIGEATEERRRRETERSLPSLPRALALALARAHAV